MKYVMSYKYEKLVFTVIENIVFESHFIIFQTIKPLHIFRVIIRLFICLAFLTTIFLQLYVIFTLHHSVLESTNHAYLGRIRVT